MQVLLQHWHQTDAVGRAVALLLLLMSISAWVVIVWKAWVHRRALGDTERAVAAFWDAESLVVGEQRLAALDREKVLLPLVRAATQGASPGSLDAHGKPSTTSTTRALLAVNHEATTDEKLTSFFIHAQGGKAALPRLASEVDKELAIHGLSVVEIAAQAGQWAYLPGSAFNRRVTPMSEVLISGPAKGSEHLGTPFSHDATRALFPYSANTSVSS